MFKLFWVTDRTLCPGDFLSHLEAIAKARPDGIILRAKDLAPEDYRALAEEAVGAALFTMPSRNRALSREETAMPPEGRKIR